MNTPDTGTTLNLDAILALTNVASPFTLTLRDVPTLLAEARRLREAFVRVEACARYLREIGVESIAQGVLPETRGRGRALVECADDIQLSLLGEQPRATACDCGLSPEDTYGGHLATCAIVRELECGQPVALCNRERGHTDGIHANRPKRRATADAGEGNSR